MKVATWNVNSIHARKDNVLDWIETHRPDVILMQETKCTDQEFPVDDLGDLGYDAVFSGERSYNGVAICARDEITAVTKGLPGDPSDDQKRLISGVVRGIRFVSLYVPNGQSLGSEKYEFKLRWLDRLADHAATLVDQPLVMSGDYNIAPTDLDAWDPSEVSGGTHVSPPERAAFQRLVSLGLTDAYRAIHPTKRAFSWWDYRAGSFQKDMGLRIDIHLISAPVAARLRAVEIDWEARRKERASDHAPVVMELAI